MSYKKFHKHDPGFAYNRLYCLVFLVFFSIFCNAQHNHSDDEEHANKTPSYKYGPKHGGQIIDAGKYKLEVVVDPMQLEDKLTVYLLKRNHKEIPFDGDTAIVYLKYRNGKTDLLILQIHNGRLVGADLDVTQSINMTFELKIGSRVIKSTYFYEGLKNH